MSSTIRERTLFSPLHCWSGPPQSGQQFSRCSSRRSIFSSVGRCDPGWPFCPPAFFFRFFFLPVCVDAFWKGGIIPEGVEGLGASEWFSCNARIRWISCKRRKTTSSSPFFIRRWASPRTSFSLTGALAFRSRCTCFRTASLGMLPSTLSQYIYYIYSHSSSGGICNGGIYPNGYVSETLLTSGG